MLVAKPGAYYTPRVSPDGRRLALSAVTDKGQDIYAYDIERDAMTQLTFDGKTERFVNDKDADKLMNRDGGYRKGFEIPGSFGSSTHEQARK